MYERETSRVKIHRMPFAQPAEQMFKGTGRQS